MTLAVQIGHIARRSMVRTLRQPANVIAPLVFPMALLAVTSAGLTSATRLRGFPTDSFLAFFLAKTGRSLEGAGDEDGTVRTGLAMQPA